MKQNELLQCLSEINSSMEKLHNLVWELLDHPAKNYSIQYGDELFEFTTAFDAQEAEDKAHKILRFVELLMIDEFTNYIKKTPNGIAPEEIPVIFSRLFALTQGVDPKDMQLERIDLKDIYPVIDADGNPLKSLPLNLDSSYVQFQNEENYESEKCDQDMVIIKKDSTN